MGVGIRSGNSVAGHQHESISVQDTETRNNNIHKDHEQSNKKRYRIHKIRIALQHSIKIFVAYLTKKNYFTS